AQCGGVLAKTAKVFRVRLERINLAKMSTLAREKSPHGITIKGAAVNKRRGGRKLRHNVRGKIVAKDRRRQCGKDEMQTKTQMLDKLSARFFIGEHRKRTPNRVAIFKHVLR